MTNDFNGGDQWSQKNKIVAKRESNDNIYHENVIIICISFEDDVKYFS